MSFLVTANFLRALFFLLCLNSVHPLQLTTQSCSSGNSQVSFSQNKVDLDSSANKISVDSILSNQKELPSGTVRFTLFAFGAPTYSQDINVCLLRACPIPPGNIPLNVTFPVPSQIPKITEDIMKWPILDLSATAVFMDSNGNVLGCTETSANPSSVATVATWGTALSTTFVGVSAIAGILNILTAGIAPQPASPTSAPSFVDIISFCQVISISGQIAVPVPLFYQSYTSSFAWTNGFISNPITKAIDNSPSVQSNSQSTLHLTSASNTTTSGNSQSQNSSPSLVTIMGSSNSDTPLVFGIARYGLMAGIEPQDLFLSALILASLICLALTSLALLIRVFLEILKIYRPYRLVNFRKHFLDHYLGNLLRIFVLAYFAVTATAFFQLTLPSTSPMYIVAIVVISFFCLGLLLFIGVKLISAGRREVFEKETLILRFGALYTQYQAKHYHFFIPYLAYRFALSLLIGFFYTSPWIQLFGVLGSEALFLGLLLFVSPFEYRFTSGMNITAAVIRTLAAGLQILWHPAFNLSPVPQLAVGIIMMVLQAAVFVCFALIFVVNTCISGCKSCFGKKEEESNHAPRPSDINPDAFGTGTTVASRPSSYPSNRVTYFPDDALPDHTNHYHSNHKLYDEMGLDTLDRKLALRTNPSSRPGSISSQAPYLLPLPPSPTSPTTSSHWRHSTPEGTFHYPQSTDSLPYEDSSDSISSPHSLRPLSLDIRTLNSMQSLKDDSSAKPSIRSPNYKRQTLEDLPEIVYLQEHPEES